MVQWILRAWKYSRTPSLLQSATATPEINPLRKTDFLLLPSGVRNQGFCRITERNPNLLRSQSSPLARNGPRRRTGTREVQMLTVADGRVSKNYPIPEETSSSNLKTRKTLSISLLRPHICTTIAEIDPDTLSQGT